MSPVPITVAAALLLGPTWLLSRRKQRLPGVVAAVCRCVCHLLDTAPSAPPARHVGLRMPAPEAGAFPRWIVLRHAIVLRAPPTLA